MGHSRHFRQTFGLSNLVRSSHCNDWLRGSFLENDQHRSAPQVGLNIMEGAMCLQRAQQLRSFGLPIPETAFQFEPRYLQI